ncbi:hypothetical protein DRJ17_05115 [Candidatus Woesearchaeota archaeon]|nr:MAG: hypothetical protein DRJ17_05115 [Candidatus Woesearchaeota archaeon]
MQGIFADFNRNPGGEEVTTPSAEHSVNLIDSIVTDDVINNVINCLSNHEMALATTRLLAAAEPIFFEWATKASEDDGSELARRLFDMSPDKISGLLKSFTMQGKLEGFLICYHGLSTIFRDMFPEFAGILSGKEDVYKRYLNNVSPLHGSSGKIDDILPDEGSEEENSNTDASPPEGFEMVKINNDLTVYVCKNCGKSVKHPERHKRCRGG